MLRAAIIFFVLGIVSMVLGIYSIAGLSIEIGKLLLFVFLVFSIISFVAGLFKGRKSGLAAIALLIAVGATGFNMSAMADDSVSETAKEVANDTKRAAKKTTRAVKDKTCEMINGKMECAAQKVKHAAQNGADNVEDAID